MEPSTVELLFSWLSGQTAFSELLFTAAFVGIFLLVTYEYFVLLIYHFYKLNLHYRKCQIIRHTLNKSTNEFLSATLDLITDEDIDKFEKRLNYLDEDFDKMNEAVRSIDNKIKLLSDKFRKITWLMRPFIK